MAICSKAQQKPIHKKIVDQIVAVDNFIAFKTLCCKRNDELNKQAFKLFEINAKATEERSPISEITVEMRVEALKNNKCLLCITEKVKSVCIPCGHMCLCFSCAKNLKSGTECPLCKKKTEMCI